VFPPLQLDACELGQRTQTEVQHPLLDKVRQCSTQPDLAASFFVEILGPAPHMRSTAMDHLWVDDTASKMFSDLGWDLAAARAELQLKAKQSQKKGWCAALFGCCGGASPTVEDGSCISIDPPISKVEAHSPTGEDGGSVSRDSPPTKVKAQSHKGFKSRLASKLRRGKRSKDAALDNGTSEPNRVVNIQAEGMINVKAEPVVNVLADSVVDLQADSTQQPAPMSRTKRCWSKLKTAFTGRSRRAL